MLRSMFSGVTGLKAHQVRMDVIGNNISNLNTIGFKGSRARFSEALSQVLSGPSRGNTVQGGTNGMQIGLGTSVGAIDNLFGQGTLENTGIGTDLAIQGEGFFILGDGGTRSYTRAGAFGFDSKGFMVDPGTGRKVQGFLPDASGNVSASSALGDIQLNLDQASVAKASGNLVLHGNLDPAATAPVNTTTTVYDSLGNKVTVTLQFTKSATANTWDVAVTAPTGTGVVTGGTGSVEFNPDGTFKSATVSDVTIKSTGAADIALSFSGATAGPATFGTMTQTAGESSAQIFSQDGYAAGVISRTSIDRQGNVIAYFSNGVVKTMAQVAMARFSNPGGLVKNGGASFVESANSGSAVTGAAGSSSMGTIASGALEGSNVDLASEFTDLVVTQRGFQANAKMITTGDEMLNELVNIKR